MSDEHLWFVVAWGVGILLTVFWHLGHYERERGTLCAILSTTVGIGVSVLVTSALLVFLSSDLFSTTAYVFLGVGAAQRLSAFLYQLSPQVCQTQAG